MDAATDQPAKPLPRLVGEYELLEELGRGGMGIVWKARQRRLNREVALKLVREGCLPGEAAAKRFRREAEAAAAIQHPHIVTIHEVGESDEQLYLSMELVPGGSLADWMRRVAFSAHDAAQLVAKVARAVHHAHQQGVLHRDLKPANILLDAMGEPRVCDFGLARLIEDTSTLTMTGEVLGTPAYLSPEQASGIRAVTTASDTYSLGAILYEMLSGKPPFSASSLPALLRAVAEDDPQRPISRVSGRRVPVDLSTICLKCLEKEPHARYASALELADDLERWIRGEPIRARPVARVERVWKWARRKPLLAGLWFLVTTLTIGVAIVSTVMTFRLRREKQEKEDYAERTKHAFARSMSDSAQRYFNVGDWLRALPALAEAIDTGTGDSRLDEANRIRFGIIRRISPKLAYFAGGEPVARVDATQDGSRLLIAYFHYAEVRDTATGNLVGRPFVTDKPISGAAFDTRRGQWAAIELDGKCIVWEPDTGSVSPAGDGHLYASPDGAENNNGKFMLLGDKEFAEIRSKTGDLIGRPLKHESRVVWAVILSEIGRVLSRDNENRLYLWDMETTQLAMDPFVLVSRQDKKPVKGPAPDKKAPGAAAPEDKAVAFDTFDPATETAVLHRDHGVGFLLNCRTGAFTEVPDSSAAAQNSLTKESPQSYGLLRQKSGTQWIYMTRNNDGVVVRDLKTSSALWAAFHGGLGFRGDVSTKGDFVATQSWNGSARVWRAGGGGRLDPELGWQPGNPPRPVTPLMWQAATPGSCKLDAFGRWLLTQGDEPAARIWLLPENDGAAALPEELIKPVELWYAGVPERLFAADQGGMVSVWEMGDVMRKTSHVQHPEGLRWSGPAANGTRIFTAGDHEARLWDSASGEARGHALRYEEPPIFAIADPSSERFAIVEADGAVRVWDAANGREMRLAAGAIAAEFSRNGRVLLTTGKISTRTWDLSTGHALCEPVKEVFPNGSDENEIHAIISPDGLRVVQWNNKSKGGQHSARVWNSLNGQTLCDLAPHWVGVNCAAFSPDGSLVATGGGDNMLRLCNTTTGQDVVPPMRHPQKVNMCGFTADGALVWGLADNDVTVWETAAGEQVSPHLRHSRNPASIVSSADGRHLAVVGASKDAPRIWDLRPETYSTGELREIAHTLSAHTIVGGSSSLRPLTPEEAKRAWRVSRPLLGGWPEK